VTFSTQGVLKALMIFCWIIWCSISVRRKERCYLHNCRSN